MRKVPTILVCGSLLGVAIVIVGVLYAQSQGKLRPQTPRAPFAYEARDVSFENANAHIRLAGTLTLPHGPGPFAAAVLIPGNGRTDRDVTASGGHKMFMVLADALTRHGVAVLRFDKRGVGASKGDFNAATSADFADDVEAGIAFLRGREEIDSERIGLVGHSEGAAIAPMVGARNPSVAWIVMMAGYALPTVDMLVFSREQRETLEGVSATQVRDDAAIFRELLVAIRDETDSSRREARLRTLVQGVDADTFRRLGLPADRVVETFMTPWFHWTTGYNPADSLRLLKCPVLALSGTKDVVVTPKENLPALHMALADNPRATIESVVGVNHMFQTSETGLPKEWATIDETIAPSALDRVSDWITQQSRGRQ